jgi:hypothetical protein
MLETKSKQVLVLQRLSNEFFDLSTEVEIHNGHLELIDLHKLFLTLIFVQLNFLDGVITILNLFVFDEKNYIVWFFALNQNHELILVFVVGVAYLFLLFHVISVE